jgi:hypothetical protein
MLLLYWTSDTDPVAHSKKCCSDFSTAPNSSAPMQNVQAPKKTILKLSTRKAPKKKVMVSANVEGIDMVLSNNSLKQLFSRMTPMKT